MKFYTSFLLICFLSFLNVSCSVKDALDKQEKLQPKSISMQVLDPEPLIASDTGYFPIFVTFPESKIVKISVQHMSQFEGFLDKSTIQVAENVTVNAKGELSRPVSTLLLNYPIKATTTASEILTVKFTFTDEAGNSVSATASKKVVNFKTNGTQEFLFATRPFLNILTNKASASSVIGNDSIRKTLDIFWIRENNIQYLLSPNSNKAAQFFATNPNYVQSQMKATKFIKLNGITFNQVDDAVFDGMDFTNGVDQIVLDHQAVYGVLLQNGKKAAVETEIYLTTFSRTRTKYQLN